MNKHKLKRELIFILSFLIAVFFITGIGFLIVYDIKIIGYALLAALTLFLSMILALKIDEFIWSFW